MLISTLGLSSWPCESNLHAANPMSQPAQGATCHRSSVAGHVRTTKSEQTNAPAAGVILAYFAVLSARPEEMWVSGSYLHSLSMPPPQRLEQRMSMHM